MNGQILNGIVSDLNTAIPIHFANVTFVHKDKGTYTNLEGNFELDVSSANQIQFSAIGYENQIINISDIQDFEQVLSIKLKPIIEELNEVFIASKKQKYTSSRILGIKND